MRLKSYLKGLGLGIIVTALILSLTSKNAKGDISDEEIKKRAAELGMVSENSMLLADAKSLADEAQKKAMASVSSDVASASDEESVSKGAVPKLPEGTVSAGAVSENGEIIYEKPLPESVSTNLPPVTPEAQDAAEETGEEMPEEETAPEAADKTASDAAGASIKSSSDNAEIVNITVNSGESSISVATKMAEAGLVNDARQFDSYLVLSGYDRKLAPGTHSIPKGSSAAEMGAILTSRQ